MNLSGEKEKLTALDIRRHLADGWFTNEKALSIAKYTRLAVNTVLEDLRKRLESGFQEKDKELEAALVIGYQQGIDVLLSRLSELNNLISELEILNGQGSELAKDNVNIENDNLVPPSSGAKINVRGGLKELASMLLKLESENTIDHVTDKEAGLLFTIRGSPVNPESLKSVRNRDL